jgi:malonate-semialdehyde dehydrogenase (acetylating) / methylmalonate-semialdehyde dehydrogenase
MNAKKMKFKKVENYIAGKFNYSGNKVIDVISPLNGRPVSSVGLSSASDVDKAVVAAQKAFVSWSALSIKERAKKLYPYKVLLENHMEDLAKQIREENGKTIEEARGEVGKSIDMVRYACSLPHIVRGKFIREEDGTEYRVERRPLGVVASIIPFNFPFLLPHYSFVNAITLGNCFILKPSKQVPMSPANIALLLKEAGIPDGVFNIVNGDKEVVDALCDHPQIEAVSFIGSSKVARYVYRRATSAYKRCLALGGSKNHIIVMPDAQPKYAAENISKSMCECAGQRCLAPSVLIAVGNCKKVIELVKVNAAKFIPGKNLGPVISSDAKNRIVKFIGDAEKAGAKIILDGRKGMDRIEGNYIGPTIIDKVLPVMEIAKEEVFGPVLSIIHVDDVESAIKIVNGSSYGNASSVFTQNSFIAGQVLENVDTAMTGVNICIPSQNSLYSFGGSKQSKFGACDITGESSIELWTRLKKTYINFQKD